MVVTELHRTAGMSETDYAAFLERGKQSTLTGHLAEADDVAKTIAFLASNKAAHSITGNTIFVDNGWSKVTPR